MHIYAQKFVALIHKLDIYMHSTHFFGSLVTLMFQTLLGARDKARNKKGQNICSHCPRGICILVRTQQRQYK